MRIPVQVLYSRRAPHGDQGGAGGAGQEGMGAKAARGLRPSLQEDSQGKVSYTSVFSFLEQGS